MLLLRRVGSEKVKNTEEYKKPRPTISADDSSPSKTQGFYLTLRKHIALGKMESRLKWRYFSSKKVSHLFHALVPASSEEKGKGQRMIPWLSYDPTDRLVNPDDIQSIHQVHSHTLTSMLTMKGKSDTLVC